MTGARGCQMILFYSLTSERGFRPHLILNNLIQNMSCAKVDCATPVFSKQPWLAEFCSLVATSNTTLKLHQIAQHPSNYVHAMQSKIITPHHVQYDDFLIHWLMIKLWCLCHILRLEEKELTLLPKVKTRLNTGSRSAAVLPSIFNPFTSFHASNARL